MPATTKRPTKDISSPVNFTHSSAGSPMHSPVLMASPVMSDHSWSSPKLPQTPPSASFSTKLFSSIKQLTRSPHSTSKKKVPQKPEQRPAVPELPAQFRAPVQVVTMSNSSSASSDLSSTQWSPSTTLTTPETSPESHRYKIKRRASQQRMAPPIPEIFVRAVTPPPTHLNAPMTSENTPYSPPFDPAFERAAASSMSMEDGGAKRAETTGLGLRAAPGKSGLVSARIPSMRFDDLSNFITDLEQRLCAANGKVDPTLPAADRRAARRASAIPKLAISDSNSSLAFLCSSGSESSLSSETLPLRPRSKVRAKRNSIIQPIAIPDRVIREPQAVSSAPPRVETFQGLSPRLSSFQHGLLDSAFPEPPQLKVQPPTPILGGAEFAGPTLQDRQRQTRLRSVHRIPPRGSSIPSPPASAKSFASYSSKKTDETPPLSPSSTDSSLTRSESCPAASDDDDGEMQLSNMMASLARPLSKLPALAEGKPVLEGPVQIAPEEEQGYQLLQQQDDGAFIHKPAALTNANLKIHTSSALTTLQANTRHSLQHFVAVVPELHTPTDAESDADYFRFEDAPSLKRDNSDEHLVESPVQGSIKQSNEGDLGLSCDTQSIMSTDCDSVATWSPASVGRVSKSRARESLWDLSGAIVSMADRVALKTGAGAGAPPEIGVAL